MKFLQTLCEAFLDDQVGDIPLHPALQDLLHTMKRMPEGRHADFRNYEGELDTRYFGEWYSERNEYGEYDEDDDWQRLSDKTAKLIDKLVREFEKKHRVKISWSTSEKNHIDFRITKKQRPVTKDPNADAGTRRDRVMKIVQDNPDASRQELIALVMRETGMTKNGAATYVWQAKRALSQ